MTLNIHDQIMIKQQLFGIVTCWMILMKNMNKENQTFESIRHIDENGIEYWYARELQRVLDYSQWRRFKNTVSKAKTSCNNSNVRVEDHFANVGKMINIGKDKILDINLNKGLFST